MRSIPAAFRESVAGRPPEPDVSGDDWLAALPRLIDDVLADWSLTVTGPAMFGQCALVLPVGDAVLKLTWPHAEAATEHLALRAWDGHGAVRLLRADPRRWALLLERLDPTDLSSVDLLEGCEIIGGLIRTLDRTALPQLATLSATAAGWESLCHNGSAGVPRRFTDQAATLIRDMTSGRDVDQRLIHQDLHFANVLRAQRAPWLAIDPKALSGEWEFAVAPVIWNLPEQAAAAYNVRSHLRLRLGLVCEAAGLDEDRAAAWTFVRVVVNALWGDDSPEWVTRMITIAKAMTD
ncbi:aminoglycoside phosphotransferase family protein [Calidifontibacter terrae]